MFAPILDADGANPVNVLMNANSGRWLLRIEAESLRVRHSCGLRLQFIIA